MSYVGTTNVCTWPFANAPLEIITKDVGKISAVNGPVEEERNYDDSHIRHTPLMHRTVH